MSQDLLPPNATAFEQGLDQATASAYDIPVPIRSLWDTDTIPSDWLPFMAWAFSVDLWSSDWSEAKRRAVVANARDYHRKKGTLAGLRSTTRLGGGKLIDAVTPPSKTFAAPTWTPAARAQWLAQYPELRIYRYRDRGQRVGAMPIPGSKSNQAKVYLLPTGLASLAATRYSRSYPAQTTAPQRVRPRVFIVQPDGSQRELTSTTLVQHTADTTVVRQHQSASQPAGESTFRIVTPGQRGKGAITGPANAPTQGKLFAGGPRRYLANKLAYRRVYITHIVDDIAINSQTLARHTVQPLSQRTDVGYRVTAGEALNARATSVAEKGHRRGMMLGTAHPGQYHGQAVVSGYLANQYAGLRLYRETHLYDPSVKLPSGTRSFHLGATRLGMPAYNAELKISYQRQRHSAQTWRYVRGHLVRRPNAPLQRLVQALRWSKSERDAIRVTTRTRQPATAGVEILAGTISAGEWTGA